MSVEQPGREGRLDRKRRETDHRSGSGADGLEAGQGGEAPGEQADDEGRRKAKKSAETILQQQIAEETEHLEAHPRGLLLSGLSAGLDIGFGPFLMAVVATFSAGAFSDAVTRILMANAYSLGFVLVVMGGSALFTEHTTLATLPVLDGRASVRDLARLWATVYAGNMVGAAIFSAIASFIGPQLGVTAPEELVSIARHLVEFPWSTILMSAILAGWMMGLVSWLVTSGRDTISQIVFVWLVTAGIGLAQLHHSVAGAVEVLMGVFSGPEVGLADFGRFLLWSSVGNAIGGVVFVALIKYGYVVGGVPEAGSDGLRFYTAARTRRR